MDTPLSGPALGAFFTRTNDGRFSWQAVEKAWKLVSCLFLEEQQSGRLNVTVVYPEPQEGRSILLGSFVFSLWQMHASPIPWYIDTLVTHRKKGVKVCYTRPDRDWAEFLLQSCHRTNLLHASYLMDETYLCWCHQIMCPVALNSL